MIPILFKKSDTNYTRNGAGRLVDVLSCSITEERNGAYECVFTYPISGRLYSEITEGDVIKAKANETSALQLFRIYAHSKPINGIATFNAEHISYDANGIPLAGFSASATTPQAAITRAISEGAFVSSFTAWSDISSLNNINISEPCSLRALLGGQQGSVLDVWGGEYEFDNYVIKLHQHRGADNGVTIEYGKNLTDVTQERNITETYTHIMPYATYTSETDGDITVTLTEKVLPLTIAENVGHQKAAIINFTNKFAENEPVTEQALRLKATAFAQSSSLGTPKVNIKASFVSLWQTEEYKSIAPLERVKLCDTVTVRFVKLGVSAKAKVIKTVYDTVAERYISVEIGDVQSSFADTVLEQNKAITELAEVVRKGFSDATAEIQEAIAEATAAITGNSGGYIVLYPSEHPQEILIMDSPSVETAVHVWRWNASGLGYSSTGYNGTYGLAMTMNGAIVADYITTGTLNGGLLRADSVQANAISAGFKQSIADSINSTKTTVEQEFAIADGQVKSIIANSSVQWEAGDITPDIFGYGAPAAAGYAASDYNGKYYVDQSNGDLYLSNGTTWVYQWTLNLITDELKSRITVTENSLSSTITELHTDYYTASETETAIAQSASSIMLGVYTKTETDTRISTAQSAAESAANTYTNTALGGYYTKIETDSRITVSKDNILLTVSSAQSKYDEETYSIDIYGYGTPAAAGYAAGDYNGKYYLNQSNGDLYLSNGSVWSKVKTLGLITDTLQSEITANTTAISAKVSKGDVVSEINISTDTIRLSTAGRLIISAGNFQLDSSGNATLANATFTGGTISSTNYVAGTGGMSINLSTGAISTISGKFSLSAAGVITASDVNLTGSIKTNSNDGYYTEIKDGRISIYYNNSLCGRISPILKNSYTALGILGTASFDGLRLGVLGGSSNDMYYALNSGNAYNDDACRHHFSGDVKFDDKFVSNIKCADNVGLQWESGIGLRYLTTGNIGLNVGIGVNNCNTYIVAGGDTEINAGASKAIKMRKYTYFYAGAEVENSYLTIANEYGIKANGSIAIIDRQGASETQKGLHIGIQAEDLYLWGAIVYVNGSPYGGGGSVSSGFTLYDNATISFTSLAGAISLYSTGSYNAVNIKNLRCYGSLIVTGTSISFNNQTFIDSPQSLWVNIGTSGYDFIGINARTVSVNGSPIATSSDQRQKQDITPLVSKYLNMMKTIDPVSFKYNSDIASSGRRHTGFTAQDVLQAMTAAGIDTTEFAAFIDLHGDGSEYALRYEEFISPLLMYVQHLEGRIAALETERTA